MKKILFLIISLPSVVLAQVENLDSLQMQRLIRDSLFIEEVEKQMGDKPKVLHAEPLYIDLIRDLGARKGEKEWNVAMGMKSAPERDVYEALVEYEWAPIDRLGLEIELPFHFDGPIRSGVSDTTYSTYGSSLESIKLAMQWSFLVSEKYSTTLALGYIHEFEVNRLQFSTLENSFRGNLYNPFFIAAKRWGSNYHTLIYTGPRFIKEFGDHPWERGFEINSNFHYMISGTRNFIGLEVNQLNMHHGWNTTLRPQMRVALAHNLMLGIVSGIPTNRQQRGISTFARIIYEPGFRAMH
ncbi:MAG: phosphoribosylformylglycinamidine synthase [Cyclobacteriaceae bacterium]|nr:phosphoribosylformylglycinamidine synthase [Cyclobacteriaceae bacterium]MCH8515126.1 phosphoribosylformylglycinamidine synthase [Cyclobacteriaceae bacterium]